MAFWAMSKYSWFKRKIPNMIYLYKKKIYDDWFNSLPPEKQRDIKEKEELEKLKAQESFVRLLALTEALKFKCGPRGRY